MKMRPASLLGVLFLTLSAFAAAGDDKAARLVGVWEITKGEDAPPGLTVEFTRDGKIKVRATIKEKDFAFDGTFKVQGNAITTEIDFGGKVRKETGKIKKLDGKELVIEDEKGKVEAYKRVK